ncbi:amidase signature enzyme [Gymnopus androsaceus JB14]|uniref:Amidase signature enzyme n=1 Tax=Gymnopus androsaceus JB14 TaxID=1447944 RepID=A0A6A4I7D2_9AGAR|nr:amidase signature enzyme [Gymnopus androsaceus JB14]
MKHLCWNFRMASMLVCLPVSILLKYAYFARIDEVNLQGPVLRAVLETNPSALAQAAALDAERNGMNTTAGSFSLLGSIVPDDAGVVKKLRAAGKANLSEFAHFRGNVASGCADPCGSSSGSGVSSSIGLTAVALGTETDGSITCPTDHNNLAGIKPSVGLTSRAGVIPISEHQDTVGPLTRSVTDAAIIPTTTFTLAQPSPVPDYTQALDKNALVGKRIGVPRSVFLNETDTGLDPSVLAAFEEALDTIRGLGATVVDPADLPSAQEILVSNNETVVLDVDFKIQLNAWFEGLLANPSGVRSLAELITFDNENPALEEPVNFTSQSDLWRSTKELGATRGIDAALQAFNLDALVLPAGGLTTVPAGKSWFLAIYLPLGFYPDNVTIGSAGPLTVYPAPGVPFGLSFLGTGFSEFQLVKTMTRLARKAFPAAIPTTQLKDVIGN